MDNKLTCRKLGLYEFASKWKTAVLCFRAPPLGGYGVTYVDHLKLIKKRIVNFLLVLIELFR